MDKNYKKDLQLKTNSVKRLLKEYQSYDKEVQKLQAKYDELKSNNVDEYDIKKQNEYLQESISAKNVTKTKLRTWTDELTNYINSIEDEEVKLLEEYKNAQEMLKNVREVFENIQD
jgi:tubulin-specific chaperone A